MTFRLPKVIDDDIPIALDLDMVVEDDENNVNIDHDQRDDVDNLFNVYGYIKCSVISFLIFDRQGWKQAKAVLEAIRKSHASDPPGVLISYFVKKDLCGLPVYCCTRAQFWLIAFSLTIVCVTTFYHYNPWLVQALSTLRADVDQEFIPSCADSYGNSHHLVDFEQFGICPIFQKIIDTFG
ncbi:uncharacterized protein EV154DRAFT_572252 [Mucor mucedo]|uniref:uncharacterized protein n=1 Tax=Mucor mucedo TaxID=29922 RepID=UPI00221EBBA7|nr:uncharacterized protein EV154DRAFT_572252 [Mucor mucedo]KAI7865120.1 hypothetical protein EV154DRAFT_572252 [Mucor mucedo]